MNEEQTKGTIRDFLTAFAARDIEKTLSFFAPNGSWTAPEGKFSGKTELKRYLTWYARRAPDLKVTETGIRTLAQGMTGVSEQVLAGTFKGRKWKSAAVFIYDFSGDTILNIRVVYDRLPLAQQVARGVFERGALNSLVTAMEEGLH